MKIWKYADASIQGKLHEKEGVPCQDATCGFLTDDICIISLADGASSCRYSHIGAGIVSKEICNILIRKFDIFSDTEKDKTITAILEELTNALSDKAVELRTDNIQAFSSTLLFAAVKNEKYIAGHIGDGVIGLLRDNKLEVLSEPDNGEFINTTYFLTSYDAQSHFRLFKGNNHDIRGFILMSDGIAESLYDRNENRLSITSKQILEWLDNNVSSIVKEALNNNLEKVIKKRTSDDCSVNLLKLIDKNFDELEKMDLLLQKEFLKSKNKIHTQNQIDILRIINANKWITQNELFRQVKNLSVKTVRKHIKALLKKNFIAYVNNGYCIQN